MSLAHLRDSNIVNTLGHGINVREKSQVSLQNSNITSSYEFTENDFTNGSNAIEATATQKLRFGMTAIILLILMLLMRLRFL